MVKPTLVLHIGTHKTATTALQEALERSRGDLAKQSIWYAYTDRPPYADDPKHSSLYHAVSSGEQAFKEESERILSEFENSRCATLVLSEEGFSEPRYTKYEIMKGFLRNFDVRIYCSVRRQDYFIESLWNQHCKFRKETRQIEDYAFDFRILNRGRFKQILDFWSGFGQVTVVDYDVVRRNDIVKPMANLLGVEMNSPATHKNVSPSMNCALMLAELNRIGLDDYKQKVIRAFRDDRLKYALGSRLRKRILAYYEIENGQLAEAYGIIFGDELPDEPSEPLRSLDATAVAMAMRNLCD